MKKLLKREYLRGLIDGQDVELKQRYTAKELDAKYEEYLKDNEETRKEIDLLA